MTPQPTFKVSPIERNIGLNAGRIRRERQAQERGWSLADVCRELTKADDSISLDRASLKRIEEGRQRVRHSEALAFARVFGVGLEVLQLPPHLAASETVRTLIREWGKANAEWHEHLKVERHLYRKVEELEARMVEAVASDPASRDQAITEIAVVRRNLYGMSRDETERAARNFYAWSAGIVDDGWYDRLDRHEATPRDLAIRDWINDGGQFPDGDR